MATLTSYWPAWACFGAKLQGLEGQPIDAFFGGQDSASALLGKVAVGDTVVAVTVRAGEVYLLASLRVTATADDALAWFSKHPEHEVFRFAQHGAQVVAGHGEAPLSFKRRTSLLPRRGLRRLQVLERAVAQQVLAQLAADPPPPPTDAEAERLMAALRAAPTDETAAQVLADRWQEKGDVRGELLSLELALARAAVSEVPALWARVEGVLRSRAGRAALEQPGGFPFRALWKRRPQLHYSLRVRTRAPYELDDVLRILSPWAEVLRFVFERSQPWGFRKTTYAEARLNRFSGGLLTHVEFAVRYPDSPVLVPFQSRQLLLSRLGPSFVTLLDARNLDLSCMLPFTADGPVPRAVLERARAALPPHQVENETLMLATWDWRELRTVQLVP